MKWSVTYPSSGPGNRFSPETTAREHLQVLKTWHSKDLHGLSLDGATITFTTQNGLPAGARDTIEHVGGRIKAIPQIPPVIANFRVPPGASRDKPTGPAKYITTTESHRGYHGSPDGVRIIELYWPFKNEERVRRYAAKRRSQGYDVTARMSLVGPPLGTPYRKPSPLAAESRQRRQRIARAEKREEQRSLRAVRRDDQTTKLRRS